MKRLISVVLMTAVGATVAAAATPTPGTAPYAVSKRGTATVVPTFRSGFQQFTPFVGTRSFTVFARLPAGRRGPTRILMRSKPASKRCAASFRLDRGTAIGLRTAFPDALGYATFTSKDMAWTRTGPTRFCVWLTSRPQARVRPIGNVITFMSDGLGVVQYRDPGSADVGIVTDIASTVPLHLNHQRANCSPPSISDRDYPASSQPDFGVFTGFTFRASCPGMTTVATITAGLVGTIGLSMTADQAVAGEVRAAGSGLCMLSNVEMAQDAARALLSRQGCRVGRVSQVPKHSVIGSGHVWSHTVNGAPAAMVATGTTVDLGRRAVGPGPNYGTPRAMY